MTQTEIIQALMQKHQQLFVDASNIRCFFAPGRVNLIGEHLDYNGGHVFPCAIDLGIYATVTANPDNLIRLYSLNFPTDAPIEFDLNDLVYKQQHTWANYPKGVMYMFQDKRKKISHGLNICFYGNLPNGAGLSSSAAIEVLTGVILNNIFQFKLTQLEVVKLAQQAENDFIGVKCGIMDQFASSLGKQDHALLLQCDTLSYQYIPLHMHGYQLIIANTNKQRTLADSKYNERKAECDKALAILQTRIAITSLGELDTRLLTENSNLLTDPILFNRVQHVVSENERTIKAASVLQQGDIQAFGQLLNQSHISLRDDYQVTGYELDSLVESAWEVEGCVGSRMTGAGFGGCSISLVLAKHAQAFITQVTHKYTQKTGLIPDFHSVNSSHGAHEISRI